MTLTKFSRINKQREENKTLLMAYLIISLLTIAQLVTIIFFLNNLVQIFV